MRGTTAAIRANTIVEPDGRELITLSVYCPSCAAWLPIDGHEDSDEALATWSERDEVPGDNEWGRTPIAEIMTRRVVCVRDAMPVPMLAALFIERGLGGAPVVDASGDLVGVVTRNDVLRFALDRYSEEALDDEPGGAGWTPEDGLASLALSPTAVAVTQIMTPFAFSLPSHAPIAQAAALMSYEGINRIVVVSSDGLIVGLLTARDIMRWVATQAGYVIPDPVERRTGEVLTAGPSAAEPVLVAPRRRRTDPARGPRLVMIVDDDASVREDYAELLREEGYQVLTAANGREALDQIAASGTPSLILLDLKMPVMDGWRFHRAMAEKPELDDVAVVLLSGSSDVYEEASRMDADDFLLKPVPVRELLGTVEQYCS